MVAIHSELQIYVCTHLVGVQVTKEVGDYDITSLDKRIVRLWVSSETVKDFGRIDGGFVYDNSMGETVRP
jgi:hypothetical protein